MKMHSLYLHFPKNIVERILNQERCELETYLPWFAKTYHHLSIIIPQNFKIYDFGCNLAPQSWYFRKHNQYIGIDNNTFGMERFVCKNTKHVEMDIDNYLESQSPRPEGRGL